MSDVKKKCIALLAEVMEVEESDIDDEAGPETIENWDSLSHVQLVIQLEKTFGIKITPEEGVEHLVDFENIVKFVEGKIAA